MAREALLLTLRLGERTIRIGGEDSPYQLLSGGADGLEAAEAAPDYRENAQLDGSYLAGVRVPGRDITLQMEIADHSGREQRRRELLSFFAPDAEGELRVERAGVVRSIGCRLRGRVQFSQETLYSFIRVRIPLYCADPYFSGDAETVILKKGAAGLLTFPLTVLPSVGVTAGVYVTEACLSAVNRGDTETGFLFTLSVSGEEGACLVNPCLVREEIPGTASEQADEAEAPYIRVLTTLVPGDVLQICTIPGRKSVYKNGERCMLFSRGSSFFSLPVGRCTLHITGEQVEGEVHAAAAFRPRYYGA